MENMEQTMQAILDRNARVEREKAWEVSWTRRLSITVLTYLIVSFFLWQLGLPYPFFQSLIPSGAYLLSTLSLPWIKRRWMKRFGSER
ncbi:MAG: hypothetical protein WCS85_00765 [Candidatus Peribacteraceae bacterium]